jgi:acyl-CoA synthetase (AMP-forming)/AMP-acid ligase II/acyl carrier protein
MDSTRACLDLLPALWDNSRLILLDRLLDMADPPLADALLVRADATPSAVAYEVVDPSGGVGALSYAQVAARASALAEQLAGCRVDGPVLLACPAGLDYPVAVFAAFLAGRPVIPAYPPGSAAPDGERLAGIVADARPPIVVTLPDHPDLGVPTVLAVPGPEADGTPWGRPAGAAAADVAIVQYTSGSTGRPRGVLVRAGSVAANVAAISDRFGLTDASRALVWLPPFHDMGLIGGLLTPVAAGIPVRIMAPGDFLKSPLWWLRQITDSGATHSGGPDFAYALCVRRAQGRGDDALAGLDLSRWEVAFNGGESVRRRTLAEFSATFAPVGFRPESFLPCYGLAEATLMVTAGRWRDTDGAAGTPVGCGTPVPGQRIALVDPERLVPVDDGDEGEIWVAGEHITPGYLSGRDQDDLFGDLDGVRHLRTGDLGYRRDGELFVTGRRKDVIVMRGVNYHAVDVEVAALGTHPGSVGTAAAFTVDVEPEPFAALVLEVRGRPDPSLAAEVRAAVLARTGLRLGVVALVPPRSVPRTSSGKVRRTACREALVAGAFDGSLDGDRAPLAALADQRARDTAAAELADVICGVVAGVCDAEDCWPADNLVDLGVDSVRAAEAAAVLEDALGLDVPLETVLTAATPRAVADALMARWAGDGHTPSLVRERLVGTDDRAGVR